MSSQVGSRVDPMRSSNSVRNHEPSNEDARRCWKGQVIAFILTLNVYLFKVEYTLTKNVILWKLVFTIKKRNLMQGRINSTINVTLSKSHLPELSMFIV